MDKKTSICFYLGFSFQFHRIDTVRLALCKMVFWIPWFPQEERRVWNKEYVDVAPTVSNETIEFGLNLIWTQLKSYMLDI